MISRLEIQGFKSLGDTSVDLGLVNVFIGANGSGKSNLLEAVGVLSAIVSGALESESLRYRGVRRGSPTSFCYSMKSQGQRSPSILATDAHFKYSVAFEPNQPQPSDWSITKEYGEVEGEKFFLRTKEKYTVFMPSETLLDFNIASSSSSYLKMALDFDAVLRSNKNYIKSLGGNIAESHLGLANLHRSFMSEIGNFAIFTPSTPQLRGFMEDVSRKPLGLGGSGLGQAIDEMMKADPGMLGPFDLEDVFELIEWADSIDTVSDEYPGQASSDVDRPIRLRIGDRFMGHAHKSVSLLEASEGALYVLFLLALVGHERSPKIFAVDNFDQSLHPRLACALTRLISEQILRDGSRQMLATTHNPLVLDGLDLLDDRVRLFTVERDADGASQVQRVLVTEEFIEKGFSLSRLWTSGRLGGVPKNL